jgi:hypothetical protein
MYWKTVRKYDEMSIGTIITLGNRLTIVVRDYCSRSITNLFLMLFKGI